MDQPLHLLPATRLLELYASRELSPVEATKAALAAAKTRGVRLGSATIAATQDLQVISGLPLLVREDDRYRAMFTLRNTTKRAMTVQASARGTLLGNEAGLPAQTVQIPAGEAREIGWDVTAPALLAYARTGTVMWEVQASEQAGGRDAGGASDRIKVSQQIVPAVPVTVQQATLAQVAPSLSIPVKAPPGALALRVSDGGLERVGTVQPPTTDPARRSLVVGDTLWTVTDAGLQASSLSTLDRLTWLPW